MRDFQELMNAQTSTLDYSEKSALVSGMIRMVQRPSEDNSTQEKHDERCRIAAEVHGMRI